MTEDTTIAFRILLAALVCAGMLAQDQPPPNFKANTNLVIINVAVKDKSGKAIEDLKKDQFTLLEDGKPQRSAGARPEDSRTNGSPAHSIAREGSASGASACLKARRAQGPAADRDVLRPFVHAAG